MFAANEPVNVGGRYLVLGDQELAIGFAFSALLEASHDP